MSEFAPQLKLLHHRQALARFIGGNWTAPPVQVEISPTNSCNAKCPWCFYISGQYKQRHSEEELAWPLLSKALQEMASMGVKAVTWTGGGDPSVYSCINLAVDLAHDLGLSQGIFTNGYRPIQAPEKLDWIRITVTEKYVITKHVAEYAKKTKVGVNFNYCHENALKLVDMAKAARDAGVSYFQVRPALADRYDLQVPYLKPDHLKCLETPSFRIVLTDYKWEDYRRPHGYPKCHGHRMVPFLWHNGDLSVCAYHFGKPEFTFGNLHRHGFLSIWTCEKRRTMCEAGVDVIPDCQHCCKLHEINKSLAVINGDVPAAEDEDFL